MSSRGEATIRDVAKASGVSTATVSRVLNDDGTVSPDTALRVRLELERLGYRMNRVARSLKTSATHTVGVIAPDLASDFFMLLAESLDLALSPHGYGIIVCSSRDSEELEGERMRLLAERLVDGVVAIPSTGSGAALAAARRDGAPLVLVDRLAAGLEADAVLVDNEGGAYAATMALAADLAAADGRPRMGFVGGSLDLSIARERYEGWRRAMRDSGLAEEREFTSFRGLRVESGYESMRAMRSRPDAPEAYFLANAYTHLGATNYLVSEEPAWRSAGVAFAAFDETPYAPLLRFCRYSVSQPVAAMGERAAALLLARISGAAPAAPSIERLPTTLTKHVVRY